MEFYEDHLKSTLLNDHIELDETYVIKQKACPVPHRPSKCGSTWIFGLRQRESNKFIMMSVAE